MSKDSQTDHIKAELNKYSQQMITDVPNVFRDLCIKENLSDKERTLFEKAWKTFETTLKKESELYAKITKLRTAFDNPPELPPTELALWKLFCCDFIEDEEEQNKAKYEALSLAEKVLQPHLDQFTKEETDVNNSRSIESDNGGRAEDGSKDSPSS